MPEQLEIAAHSVTAILATWLGLVVLTRSRRRRGARLFALIAGYLVLWSVAIVVQRLTRQPETVIGPLNALEDVAAFLLPVGTLHIALTLAVEGAFSRVQRAALVAGYAVSVAMAVGAIVFPEHQFRVSPPHFELPGVAGEVFGWAWVGARILILAAATYWVIQALGLARGDTARHRQLLAVLATVVVGAIGGVLRFTPGIADGVPWLGVAFVTMGVIMAAYAVLAQGVFLTARVAERAFRYSVGLGLGVTLFVAVVIGLEGAAQDAFAVDLPIVTALVLVATIALVDPVATWLRSRFTVRSAGDQARDRLHRALGSDLTEQSPETVVSPVLARITRTLALDGAAIEDLDGDVIARHGRPAAQSSLAVRLPLRGNEEDLGWALFGPKASHLPFTPGEAELLSAAAEFIAASLELGARHRVQAVELESLSADSVAVDASAEALSSALTAAGTPSPGLRIFALGPLRVERGGVLLERWGGRKAGSRQAEAVFAFLFDRGDLGAGKDEIVELIWPEVDPENADVAFHRTLNALRTTLEPERRRSDRHNAVMFSNDRYRLDPAVIEWTDVRAFDASMRAAGTAGGEDAPIMHLERARSLYRGEYLDDCPFYGDSTQVEERRGLLRRRCVDLLLALGERYERRGDRPAAAASFRQAQMLYGDALPLADEALSRMGMSA